MMLFLEAEGFYNCSRLQQMSGSLEVRITPVRIVTVTSLGWFDHVGLLQGEFEGFVDWWGPGKWLVSKRFSLICPVDAKWMRCSEFSSLLAAYLHWLLTADMSALCQDVCGLMVVKCRCIQMFVKDSAPISDICMDDVFSWFRLEVMIYCAICVITKGSWWQFYRSVILMVAV